MQLNTFKNRLSELLEQSSKTQKKICESLNMTEKKLSKLKTGYNEPNLEDITIISQYFNVSADYLLGLSDDDLNYQNYDTPHNLSETEIKLIQKYRALSPDKKDKAYRIIDELNPQKLTTLEIAAYYGGEKTVSITEDAKRQILREMDAARKNRKKPPKK